MPTPAADAEGAEAESLALTPVAAPENIVGVATLRAPARTLDVAMTWTGLGLNWRAMIESGPAAPFLPVLNLDAPVDVVVTLDPKVKNRPRAFFAASIGITSRQAALEVFESMKLPVEFVEPGVHGVRPNDNTFCFLSAALGVAKARLVCGEDRESVELLQPLPDARQPLRPRRRCGPSRRVARRSAVAPVWRQDAVPAARRPDDARRGVDWKPRLRRRAA